MINTLLIIAIVFGLLWLFALVFLITFVIRYMMKMNDRRKKRSWVQVAMMLSKSESQCRRDLVGIKKRYQNSMFSRQPVDNLVG